MPCTIDRLADDVADLHARVQRAVRVLEDHLDAPAQRQQSVALQLRDVDAVVEDLAGGRRPAAASAAGRGLAAAALADQAQRLAAADVKSMPSTAFTSPTSRARQMPSVIGKCMLQSLDLEQRSVGDAPLMPPSGLAAELVELRKHAARWPGAPAGSSGGRASAQLDREAAARTERAAGSSRVRSGGWPSTGSSRSWRGRSSRGTERSSADRVGMPRVVRRHRPPAPLSTMRPAYITLTRSA